MGKVLALVGVVLASFALVGTALANHSWGGYHWSRSANPLVLSVGDNVDSRWEDYLSDAITDWNKSSVLHLNMVSGGTNPASCGPTPGRMEVCNGSYGSTGWLGIAQIWLTSGSHITQATTKLNDTYFDTSAYNTAAWRRLVTCQEIAHDFGLDHQDENFNNPNLGTCMDYTNDPDGGAGGASSSDPSNEHPNQHDYDELVTIYSHLDGSGGGGGRPCHGKKCSNGLDGAPSFSQASRANGDVYVDHLPNGGRRLTHVFWALG